MRGRLRFPQLAATAFASLCLLSAAPASAQKQEVVEIDTRAQRARALLLRPDKAVASAILLAGGHGNLALGNDGAIGWGAGNQLVRTRAAYAKAGFATLVPDIAPDHKQGSGGVPRYRWSEAYARDIGAYVKFMRSIAAPVYLIGTSRAALSVAKAAVLLTAAERPDALIITSGMLVSVSDAQPSAERNVAGLGRITQPTLLVYHREDGCAYTPASSAAKAKRLLTGAKKVDIVLLQGGSAGGGDPCEARSHHGFEGQDDEVVRILTTWLRAL